MSVETKVLSTSTRANVEALKHHMKKLGFKYFKEKDGWIDFGTSLYEGRLSNTNEVSVHFNNRNMFSMFDDLDLYDKLPEVKQTILDFYEAEGITE